MFFAASSVVWSLVLCAVAVAGVFAYDARLDADFSRIGLIVAQMPPAPPPPAARQETAVRPTATPQQTGLIARNVAPDAVTPPTPHPPAVGSGSAGVPGGDPNGRTDGVIGGDPSSPIGYGDPVAVARPETPPPPPQPDPPVVQKPDPIKETRPVSVGVIAGKATRRVEPPFPPMAKAAGVTGDVVVEVSVDRFGHVTNVRALSGHPLLTKAALDAARAWQFSPTLLSGTPVAVIGTITFSFKR
jgi:protein TonB